MGRQVKIQEKLKVVYVYLMLWLANVHAQAPYPD